uniref:cytochrome P450 2U1-like n=1 Tax=Ciona intestinalis TaxID=7719 RepID=UPI00089DC2F1|nr:cytochrome P450 2U1-like [Ciona intestinalis]|eukprot:XP_002123213.4 cytochrome P450 2U1-like [Ciona intestinalis]
MIPSYLIFFEFPIVATVLVLVCLFYWYRRPKNSPPGPRGIPLLGVLPLLGRYPERTLHEWSKKYGPVMSVRMGRQDWLVLGDHGTIHQALVKQSHTFSGRPHVPTLHRITQGRGLAFVDHGPAWKAQRKFGAVTLRGFGVGKKGMEDKIVEEVHYLNDAIRQHEGKPFNILAILSNAVSNNICSVILGRRFDYNDKDFQDIVHKMTRDFTDPKSTALTNASVFAPVLDNFPPFAQNTNQRVNDAMVVREMLLKYVKEHKATFDREDARDFIDAFLKEAELSKEPSFNDTQLLHYLHDLFLGGTETTTSTLRWALLCLLHYPQTQTKLREEINEVIGDGKVSYSCKVDMPYTCAFIQELYRYRTLLPLSLTHKTNEKAMLGEYTIPKSTIVSVNLWAVHNDPNTWEEPSMFKPERHLDESGHFVQSKHVIPFSVGPRHCVGEQLARMEVFIYLVSMVQKFEFLPDPNANELPDIEKGSNGPAFVPQMFDIVAKVI